MTLTSGIRYRNWKRDGCRTAMIACTSFTHRGPALRVRANQFNTRIFLDGGRLCIVEPSRNGGAISPRILSARATNPANKPPITRPAMVPGDRCDLVVPEEPTFVAVAIVVRPFHETESGKGQRGIPIEVEREAELEEEEDVVIVSNEEEKVALELDSVFRVDIWEDDKAQSKENTYLSTQLSECPLQMKQLSSGIQERVVAKQVKKHGSACWKQASRGVHKLEMNPEG
ncbi:hypothetical protein F5877DRAFT_63278 [Lentinula edodes]|nr:hypothetical protein F5877DRAFT_63278 [Lentinula edodes]